MSKDSGGEFFESAASTRAKTRDEALDDEKTLRNTGSRGTRSKLAN